LPYIDTRYGQLSVPDSAQDVIGRFLAQYGEWAWDEACFVASILPKGARVLDVGAYVGTFGLGVGLRQSLGSLCCVEANPEIVPLLRANIERLARQPSDVIAAMVSGDVWEARTGHFDPSNLGSLSFAEGANGDELATSPEQVLTLKQIREAHGPFDLIKLDVEGMEADIIRSDADFLSSGESMLWLECNEAEASLGLAELLLEWGLNLYYFAFPSYNPNNLRNDPDPIYPFAYEAGLLAGRTLAPILDASLAEHQCILKRITSIDDLREALWRTPRWGMREWEGASANEVAALAGRALLGQELEKFLAPGVAAAEWRGAGAFTTQLQDIQAKLKLHEVVLAAERQVYADLKQQFEELQGRSTELEVEIRAGGEVRAQLQAEIAALGKAIVVERQQGMELRERWNQTKAVASDRLFQLDSSRQRLKVAEGAAADTHIRLLTAVAELGAERERSQIREAELIQALASTQYRLSQMEAADVAVGANLHKIVAQFENLAAAQTQAPSSSGKRRSRFSRTKWYAKTFRPGMKKLRRLLKGKSTGLSS